MWAASVSAQADEVTARSNTLSLRLAWKLVAQGLWEPASHWCWFQTPRAT